MQTTETQQATHSARNAAVIRDAILEAEEQQQYLTFLLSDEMFALGILAIREIIGYGYVTEVPMTPPFIRGVINLRGAVVPVVDLAVRFGREARPITKRTCIVIVEVESVTGSREMGVVVDAVSEVLEISRDEIESPPEFGSRIRSDFIKGMGKINGRFVILLDVNRVLLVDEVAVAANMTRLEAPPAA